MNNHETEPSAAAPSADAERRESPSPTAPAARPQVQIRSHWSQRGVREEWYCSDLATIEEFSRQFLMNYGYAYGGAVTKPQRLGDIWMCVAERYHSAD